MRSPPITAACAILPRLPNAPPWSRPTLTGSAWPKRRRRSRAPAATPSSWRPSARPRALRALLPEAIIYVFAGLMPGTAELYRAADLRPVLNSADEIKEWASFCAGRGEQLPCAVHIDSGMNRLGLSADEVDQVAKARELWQAMTLSLVMSHLACADEPDHPKSEAQRKLVRPAARAPAAGACEPRQFRRHSARARLYLRSGAARHRALWRPSPPPRREPVSARGASQGPHPPSAPCRPRRDRRLRRDADHAPGRRASPSSRWAMPTGSSARCRPRMARTVLPSISGLMPRRSWAACPWT